MTGRALSDYLRNLPQARRYLWWFAKVVVLFRRPFRFLLNYLRRTSPGDCVVEMRDGTRFYLSGHPHDVITLFVIFVREDYGRFPPGGTVVDIGANLGPPSAGVISHWIFETGIRPSIRRPRTIWFFACMHSITIL